MSESLPIVDRRNSALAATPDQLNFLAGQAIKILDYEAFGVNPTIKPYYRHYADYRVGDTEVTIGFKGDYKDPTVQLGVTERFSSTTDDSASLVKKSSYKLVSNDPFRRRYTWGDISENYLEDDGIRTRKLIVGQDVTIRDTMRVSALDRARQIACLQAMYDVKTLSRHRCSQLIRLVTAFDPATAQKLKKVDKP
jgi:hypothetical protein